MRFRLFLLFAITAGILAITPAIASAAFLHVVAQGESLSSIAAADGLNVDQLAAANGLSPNAELIAGSNVEIPPQQPGVTAPTTNAGGSAGDGDTDADDPGTSGPVSAGAAQTSSGAYVVQPGDTLSAIAARAGTTVDALAAANGLNPNAFLISGTAIQLSSGSGSSGSGVSTPAVFASGNSGSSEGAYVVQPGDTLSAIAARAGTTVDALAAANGLNPNAFLISGTTLQVSGGSTEFVSTSSGSTSSGSAATQPVGAPAQGSPTDPPYPTPERVSASEIGSVAQANGVPASLADAIAWQESGFNNDLVSTADARGVMQILPGTWQWIQGTLDTGGPPLAPASAADNVRGGVLLLHSLLNSTGGDPALAAAGYYQGLPSVQEHGVYPSTQQYVNSVLALEHQFGGG